MAKATRRRNDCNVPVSFLPQGNPPARVGYACAWLGLIPGLGVLFGLPAMLCGVAGRFHARRDPDKRGNGHAMVSIVAGFVQLTSNAAGWWLLWDASGL